MAHPAQQSRTDLSATTGKLVSHGSIYLAGNILRRMVSFVMLPIYTRYLTPEHYGTLELLSMVVDVVAILFGLRIGEAVFRFYYKFDSQRERHEVVFTSLCLVVSLNAIGVLALVVGASPISRVVFGSTHAAPLIALFSFTLVLQSLTETVLTFVRAQQRPWLFVGFSTLKLAIQLGLNIFFVVQMQMAVEGVIYSNLVAGVALAIPLGWYTVRQTGFRFSLEKARAIASFSLPLVLTSLISFYMTFGDRYFLRLLGGGLDEVGIYSLGYRFGFLLSFLVGEPFFGIWNSEKYVAAKQPDAQRRFQISFVLLSAALVWVTVGISIYVHDVLRIMSDPAFWSAALIVPIVMLGAIFQNWTSFGNMGILLNDRTSEIAVGTIVSAAIITVGYLTLIPMWGGVGAAVATVIAMFARMVWIVARAERLYPLQLPWRRAIAMLGLGGIAWGAGLLTPEPLWQSLLITTLIFTAFSGVLFAVFIPHEQRHAIIRTVQRTVFTRRASIGAGRQAGEATEATGQVVLTGVEQGAPR